MSSKTPPHVLIIGAGIGGLTLAQALRKRGISFEIFERDADEHSRTQGWAIGLHSAVDEVAAALPADLPSIQTTNHLQPLPLANEIAFYDTNDVRERQVVRDDGTGRVIRASRTLLRRYLSLHIPVRYGKAAARVTASAASATVHFRDGTSATGDVVVGADGAHSVARAYLLGPAHRPRNLPVGTIIGELALAGDAMERQLALGHSCWLAGLPAVGAEAKPSDGSVRGFLFAGLDRVGEDGRSGAYYWMLNFLDEEAESEQYWTRTATADELRDFALKVTTGLASPLRWIVEQTPAEGILMPPFVLRDVELPELPVSRVTLLGDAAHCMAPFRGEGGIHAMRDALHLAAKLDEFDKNDVDGLKRAVKEYQDEMRPRGNEAVRLSRNTIDDLQIPGKRFAWGQTAESVPAMSVNL